MVEAAGGRVLLGREVVDIVAEGARQRLETADGDRVYVVRVVVCAGRWADRLARRAGAPADPRIVPFRGACLTSRHTDPPVVRGLWCAPASPAATSAFALARELVDRLEADG